MLVALVAAVTIGPAYYSAAQSSILQDTVNQAQVTGRGFELSQSGPVAAVDSVTVEARTTLAAHLGGPAAASRIFGRPVTAAETTVQAQHQTVPLVYGSGACGQLHFTAGRCPAGADQVAVSSSLAFLFHWHVGQRIAVPTWHQLTITGMYRITAAEGGASYWFDAGGRYFPYENIEITLFAAGMPAGQAAAAARAALAAVGLAEHAGQLADELSGGQQQRVAVARALASQPTVLLADEPTAEQDSKSRELVLDRMLRIGVAGGALVLATHDPEVAQRCDRVLDLSQLRTEPVSDPGLAPR